MKVIYNIKQATVKFSSSFLVPKTSENNEALDAKFFVCDLIQ